MNEDKYKEDLTANGVELPELEEKVEEKVEEKETDTPTEEPEEEAEGDEPEEEPEGEKVDEEEQKPKSIYKEFKEKKAEVKTLKEEKAELQRKLDAVEKAKTPEEKTIAKDKLEKFAEDNKLDPTTLKALKESILDGVTMSPADKEKLSKVDEILAEREFEKSFNNSLKALKEIFPRAADVTIIKDEILKLSQQEENKGKSLDYIAFMNRGVLSTLVTPKIKGIEGKGRKETDTTEVEFNPEADYSKMSPKEREAWEKQYSDAGKREGLSTDAQGRKLFI